jgi:putative spermidine/putrescine transport system substrate-binding protein
VKKKTVYDPFREATGIEIVPVASTAAKLLAMFKAGQVDIDVIDTGDDVLLQLEQAGALEPMPYKEFKLTNPDDIDAGVRLTYQVGSFVYAFVLGFNTTVYPVGKEPKSWAEFWDIKAFPGTRTLADMASGSPNLEIALIADGVPMDKVYPIDFDRAFKKLDQIKPHVNVWWATGQQPAQLLLDKEVVLATGWNGRFYDLIKKGAPIAIEWNQGALKQGSFVIPRGAKNVYWGQKMLAEMSIPQQQAIYASELGYPGLNLESLNYVDAKVKPFLPTQYIDKQFWIDDSWYAENGTKALELWNAWKLKKA